MSTCFQPYRLLSVKLWKVHIRAVDHPCQWHHIQVHQCVQHRWSQGHCIFPCSVFCFVLFCFSKYMCLSTHKCEQLVHFYFFNFNFFSIYLELADTLGGDSQQLNYPSLMAEFPQPHILTHTHTHTRHVCWWLFWKDHPRRLAISETANLQLNWDWNYPQTDKTLQLKIRSLPCLIKADLIRASWLN